MDFYPLFELTGSFFLFLTVLVDVLTRVSVCESVRKRCVDMGLADNVHTGKCVALIFLPFGMIFDVTVTDINIKDHLYQFCPLHSSAHVYYIHVCTTGYHCCSQHYLYKNN